jgi:hypothetical protein
MTPPAAFNLVISPDGNLLLQAPPSAQYARTHCVFSFYLFFASDFA